MFVKEKDKQLTDINGSLFKIPTRGKSCMSYDQWTILVHTLVGSLVVRQQTVNLPHAGSIPVLPAT